MGTLHEAVARWLSPEGDRKALQLSSTECSLVLRRVRKKSGWVGCWSQAPREKSARLSSAGFHQPSPGEYWLRELERPTADVVCDLWAHLGGEPANTRTEWLVDHVSVGQVLGIGFTLAAWIALTVVAVVYRVPPVSSVFDWFGGFARPTIAGGAALITVAAMAMLPLVLLSKLSPGRKRPSRTG